MIKRSMTINGHRTSISLEADFWQALQLIAQRQGCSLARIVANIDIERSKRISSGQDVVGLSSTILLYILTELMTIVQSPNQ